MLEDATSREEEEEAMYGGKAGLGPVRERDWVKALYKESLYGDVQQFITGNGHMGPPIVDRMTDKHD